MTYIVNTVEMQRIRIYVAGSYLWRMVCLNKVEQLQKLSLL